MRTLGIVLVAAGCLGAIALVVVHAHSVGALGSSPPASTGPVARAQSGAGHF
jgi:hypothetical protein